MSVIAWDGNIIAADSQLCEAGYFVRPSCKLIKKEGIIFGSTGNAAGFKQLVHWYLNGKQVEDWPDIQSTDDWTRLIVVNHCKVTAIEKIPLEMQIYEEKFTAWGHGSDFAVGAMEMGATAIEAVRIACKYDTFCGGRIDSFTIEEE